MRRSSAQIYFDKLGNVEEMKSRFAGKAYSEALDRLIDQVIYDSAIYKKFKSIADKAQNGANSLSLQSETLRLEGIKITETQRLNDLIADSKAKLTTFR